MPKTRRRLLGLAAAAVAAIAAAPAVAQSNQTVSGSMTLFQPIVLTKTSDLAFGTLMRPQTGNGTAAINAQNGQLTATGGIAIVNSGGASRAVFNVSGEGGLNFTVTVPQSFNMTRNGNQDPLQVTLNSTMGGGTLSGSNGSTGAASFGVGGQVVISSGTPTGAYSGTFTVTVAYN